MHVQLLGTPILGTVHYHSPENDIFESQAVHRKNGDGDDFGRFGLI
jgi:hypothetical protein